MLAAQETVCTPFDNNGDNVVGIGDLIDLLARFGDSDLDQDNIWDSEDDCVGAYDTCGVCNGPGPQVLAIDTIVITYDSIYVEAIDDWLTYELSRDTLLHLVCENPGCTDPVADNYDPYAEEGGLCTYLECLGPTIDGHTYEVVLIGDQCWFAENLRTTVYRNGDTIPAGLTDEAWTSTTSGATAVYDNDASYVSTYGRLYNWYAGTDTAELCPSGWHVPTDGEWTDLENYISSLGFIGTEGTALKSTSDWGSIGGNGTDNFGFSAFPGGRRYYTGSFQGASWLGYWWSSSTTSEYLAFYRGLDNYETEIERIDDSKAMGFSVRCLRDAD